MTTSTARGLSALTLPAIRRADSSDVERRGRLITNRRIAHGIKSQRQFAEETGIHRATLAKVEAGTGTEEMVQRVEEFLDSLDLERGVDTRTTEPSVEVEPLAGPDVIEFEVTGPRTEWHVVVRGPAELADQLRHQAGELLKDLSPERND